MQKPQGIELGPPDDPVIATYLKLHNEYAPTKELEQIRFAFLQRFGEAADDCIKEYFTKCEKVRLEELMWERGQTVEQAKDLKKQIEEVQQANGLRSALQPGLQTKVQDAVEKMNEYMPCSRATSSLEEIGEDEAEQNRLRQAVQDARDAGQQNSWGLEIGLRNAQQLYREYRQLEAKVEGITKAITELKLPPEQRRKTGSSIVWQGDDGTVFQAMRS
jgi:hypothetical protein